jgi:spermidine synthase
MNSKVEVPARVERQVLMAVGLNTFATLLLELALTRLFSVVLFYHFAFLAISIALLGLGAGGVFAYLLKRRLEPIGTSKLASGLSLAGAAAVVLALEAVLHVPVSLEVSWPNFLHLSAIYSCAAVPFILTGFLLSTVFARSPESIPHLYAADLMGASLACLAIVPLLDKIGGPNTVLAAALATALAASVWSWRERWRGLALVFSFVLAALITANSSGRLIDIVYAKGLLRNRSWVEFARWNAISRVEVDRQGGGGKAIVIDADASTYVMNADPSRWRDSEWERDLMAAPPALVNVLRPQGRYAIIGPGGGVDVLRAVANGSPSVTGIEINPIIADTIMRGRYADYTFHLYERPEVHIAVTDGRSFVRSVPAKFDVVQMTLVDTWASTAAGAFALSENNLYTVEAFQEYLEHLTADGIIAVTRWEFRRPREALRVVSQGIAALRRLGVSDVQRHFIVVSEGQLDEDGIPVVVLVKKSGFAPREEEQVEAHLRANPELASLYLPSKPGNNAFSALIASGDPIAFSRTYDFDVSPVTDNSPFFFFTLKTAELLHPGSLEQGIDWKVNLGVAVLGGVFILSIAGVLLFLIIPLAASKPGRQPAVSMLYFVAVGLGYILVEIAFIQRFVLFLGHPTYALTVVVFLLLISSGVGSLLMRSTASFRPWMPLTVIILAVSMYVFFLPGWLEGAIGVSHFSKLLISGALLVPLGVFMGMPFPSGLKALAQHKRKQGNLQNAVEWAWAMNAASSVLGSVLAIVVAIHFGLNVTLACGAGAYLAALLTMPALLSVA